MKYYLLALKRYFRFSGRASRRELWMFALFSFIFAIVSFILDWLLIFALRNATFYYGGAVYGLYLIAMLVPSLAVQARRLHDVDRSAWWLLLTLIPLGELVLLYWFIMPAAAWVCPYCGAPLQDGSVFCGECGRRLS